MTNFHSQSHGHNLDFFLRNPTDVTVFLFTTSIISPAKSPSAVWRYNNNSSKDNTTIKPHYLPVNNFFSISLWTGRYPSSYLEIIVWMIGGVDTKHKQQQQQTIHSNVWERIKKSISNNNNTIIRMIEEQMLFFNFIDVFSLLINPNICHCPLTATAPALTKPTNNGTEKKVANQSMFIYGWDVQLDTTQPMTSMKMPVRLMSEL